MADTRRGRRSGGGGGIHHHKLSNAALLDHSGPSREVLIGNLRPNMSNFNTTFVILQTRPVEIISSQQTKVYKSTVADRSGSCTFTYWGGLGQYLAEGDIMKADGCYTKIFNGTLELAQKNHGSLTKIGEDTMLFSSTPNVSSRRFVLKDPNDPKSGWLQADS